MKKTDQTRYLLKDILQGNYKNNTIQSWQIGEYIWVCLKREKILIGLQNQLINVQTGQWKEK